MDNALLVVKTKANAIAEVHKTKANATAEVDKVSAGEVRVGPVKGCEGERSKVMRGRGRGWEGRRLREVRRRRGALEKIRAKRWEKTCPVFFFIFRRWQVALSAICQLLNMKKNSLHNLSEGKFSKGVIFVSLPK